MTVKMEKQAPLDPQATQAYQDPRVLTENLVFPDETVRQVAQEDRDPEE